MKNYRNLILIGILTVFMISCSENKKKTQQDEKNTTIKTETKEKLKSFKMEFDKTKISKYTIEDSEIGGAKTIIGKMSDYTTKELKELPSSKRLTLSIVVPYNISKENLENTLKSIVAKKTVEDNNIDEVVIFAYDDKNDIGNGYTFGKLLWAPNGKTGMMTPEIVLSNNRNSYEFKIIIKEKVGNIKKVDLPTKRELEIYNEIMSEKYWDMQEEESEPIIMKKFKISKKELNDIWLKVAAHKL